MTDYKILLRDIIEMFYQSPFKIFNVNSLDGKKLMKPIGYFISLGITTSLRTIKDLAEVLNKSDYDISARIVELRSYKNDTWNEFLNVVSDIPEDQIKKYPSPIMEDTVLLEKSEAESLLETLKKSIEEGNYTDSYIKQKLQDAMAKLETFEGGWDTHKLMKKEKGFNIFHNCINYLDKDNVEYRIGIYVTKN